MIGGLGHVLCPNQNGLDPFKTFLSCEAFAFCMVNHQIRILSPQCVNQMPSHVAISKLDFEINTWLAFHLSATVCDDVLHDPMVIFSGQIDQQIPSIQSCMIGSQLVPLRSLFHWLELVGIVHHCLGVWLGNESTCWLGNDGIWQQSQSDGKQFHD